MITEQLGATTGRSAWIPYAFIGFFAVVLLANGAMIWLAFTTWTGLETTGAYEKGLAYNDTLEEAKAQAALGWSVEAAFEDAGARTLETRIELADRYGNLIRDARVRASFVRPTHDGHDLVVDVHHAGGGGYATTTRLPLAGQWDVRLMIEADGHLWRMRQRVQLAP